MTSAQLSWLLPMWQQLSKQHDTDGADKDKQPAFEYRRRNKQTDNDDDDVIDLEEQQLINDWLPDYSIQQQQQHDDDMTTMKHNNNNEYATRPVTRMQLARLLHAVVHKWSSNNNNRY